MTKYERLAEVAEQEAKKCYHGNVMTMKSNLQPLEKLFSDVVSDDESLDGFWCAAFVYFCCVKAGFKIPPKYPNNQHNIIFLGCLDWEIWAKLPENSCYYEKDHLDFVPSKGDIILYDHVFCNESHDHIGIIVDIKENSFIVAEGNINNVSGVVERQNNKHIRGYIRIPNYYN